MLYYTEEALMDSDDLAAETLEILANDAEARAKGMAAIRRYHIRGYVYEKYKENKLNKVKSYKLFTEEY